MTTERRGIRTFLPASKSLAGMKSRTCLADLLHLKGSGTPKIGLFLPALVLAIIALTATPALANQARIFQGAFGCEKGVVGCTEADPYPLAAPGGVAVDEPTGDLYIVNKAVDDEQSVTVHATGGTFELVFENPLTHETKTTAPIAFTGHPEELKDEEEVRVALEDAGAGAGNVQVRGAGSTEYKITFIGALTGADVKTMTADGGALTGAGTSVSVSSTRAGLPGDDVEKLSPVGEFILMFGRDVNKMVLQGSFGAS
jgi:hypothetical protein